MKKVTDSIIAWYNRSAPVILGVVILLLITGVGILRTFQLLGYTFAIYADVKPDWDAIGTVFSFISSLGAIGAAIFIPWQISQKQNRITLFNEKYEIYRSCLVFFEHWAACAELIIDSPPEKRLFACAYSIESYLGKGDNAEVLFNNYFESDAVPHEMLTLMRDIRAEGRFTFDKASCVFICVSDSDTTEITKSFSNFFDSLRISIYKKELQEDIISTCTEFVRQMDLFKKQALIERMKNEIGKIET